MESELSRPRLGRGYAGLKNGRRRARLEAICKYYGYIECSAGSTRRARLARRRRCRRRRRQAGGIAADAADAAAAAAASQKAAVAWQEKLRQLWPMAGWDAGPRVVGASAIRHDDRLAVVDSVDRWRTKCMTRCRWLCCRRRRLGDLWAGRTARSADSGETKPEDEGRIDSSAALRKSSPAAIPSQLLPAMMRRRRRWSRVIAPP
jgi:hypothetical protein